MNVLIVDPDPLFRAGLIQILRSLAVGSNISEAGDLYEVERRLDEFSGLDLVLADVQVLEFKLLLRKNAITKILTNIPVLIISAPESREYALETIKLGAQGFIPKSANRLERFQIIRGHTLRQRRNFGILPA